MQAARLVAGGPGAGAGAAETSYREPVHRETPDVNRLNLAASFLSNISLRPAMRRWTVPSSTNGRNATAAGSSCGIAPAPRSEAERRDATSGFSWQAAAALNFLSKLQLNGPGRPDHTRNLGVDSHVQKEPASEGLPVVSGEGMKHVLTFAQLREWHESGSSGTGPMSGTRVLFRGSAMGPPCLALSVLPFGRGDDGSMSKREPVVERRRLGVA